MGKGKLILICQSGGEFKPNDDGTLSYSGGEAHAIDITNETLFDELKITLAESCKLDLASLSVKYFLPGNKKIPISLSSDKDLKRMYEFHTESVTAEVFISGKPGLNCEGFNQPITTAAVTVPPTAAAVPASTLVLPPVSTRKAVKETVKRATVTRTPVVTPAHDISNDFDDANLVPVTITLAEDNTIPTDMNATPADTVKKRRRTAAWKSGGEGPSNDAVGDVIEEKPKSSSRKKYARKSLVPVIDCEPINSGAQLIGTNNLPLEELVAAWKEGITGVGHSFVNVQEFRDALQKYAIANRFSYKLKKNDASRVSAMCVVEGCSWKIHASWVPSGQVFQVKKLNDRHTCGGESWKSPHVTKNWLVNTIKERLHDTPYRKPKDIAKMLFEDFGLELNYTQIRRGVGDAKEQLQGSYKDAYVQLPHFCDKLVESNPGSLVKLVIGDERRFQRVFVSFNALLNGFQNGCRPLIFLDATSLRSKFHEMLLTASALDGNDGVFPVAFAVVDVENEENWHWFLEQLRTAVSTSRQLTFVSDKEKGLMKPVLEVFENAYHGYCIYHLLESFMSNLKGPFHGDGRGSLPVSFLHAAHAVRLERFKMYTEQIKSVCPHAYEWLMQIEPEYWCSALFKGERYNQVTFDVGELYANWVEEVRDRPIIQKLEKLASNIMELMNDRRVEVNQWSSSLTPSKEAKLREESLKSHGLKVLFSSDTLFEVHDNFSNVVDIDKRDCSCTGWEVSGLPCRHAIAVFNCTGRSVYDYCPIHFTVDSYRRTYFDIICPVTNFKPVEEDDIPENEQVFPPTTPRPPNQQKKKQTKTLGVFKRTVCCTRCKAEGHNKSTCKEPL